MKNLIAEFNNREQVWRKFVSSPAEALQLAASGNIELSEAEDAIKIASGPSESAEVEDVNGNTHCVSRCPPSVVFGEFCVEDEEKWIVWFKVSEWTPDPARLAELMALDKEELAVALMKLESVTVK